MSHNDFYLLLHKKWTLSISPPELKALEDYLASSESAREEARELEAIWEQAKVSESSFEPDVDAAYARFRSKLSHKPAKVVRFSFFRRAAAAAAVLLLLGALIYRMVDFSVSPSMAEQGAIETDRIVTDKNTEREIILPDGSHVFVNRRTTLSYREEDGLRIVEMRGEAYFRVKADPNNPFIVQTLFGETRAIGTRFNVRAYDTLEPFVKVYLESGQVLFTAAGGGDTVAIQPDHTLTFNASSGTTGTLRETNSVPLFWAKGRLNFKNAPILDMLPVLSEYFGVEFDGSVLKGSVLRKTRTIYFGGFSLEETILSLEKGFDVKISPDPASQEGRQKYLVVK